MSRERGRSGSSRQGARQSEIRPIKAGNFGSINLTTGRQAWHGESYWASRAGKAIVTKAVKGVDGVQIRHTMPPGFEDPTARGSRKYHVSVVGSEGVISQVNSKVGELADKVEGVQEPSNLGERFFVGRVRAIAKFEKS